MNIFSFGVQFTDEQSCRMHFKSQRDQQGVVCKRCQGTDHYWLQNKWSYQCKSCNSRTSLRSGTIMESSKLSFLIWYKAIFLLSATKKKINAWALKFFFGFIFQLAIFFFSLQLYQQQFRQNLKCRRHK